MNANDTPTERVARAIFRAEINAAVWPLQGGSINMPPATLGSYTHNVTQVVAALREEGYTVARLVAIDDETFAVKEEL